MLGCNYGVFTACLLFLIAFIALYFGKFLWFSFALWVFTSRAKVFPFAVTGPKSGLSWTVQDELGSLIRF